MNVTRTLALALAFTATPVMAQIRGSINRDAPTVSHSITFKNQAKIEVSYTAIRFGEGSWQAILENKDGHEEFSKFAANSPIGSVTTTSAISAAGRLIAAGEYDLYFTPFAGERGSGWSLNLKNKTDDSADLIRFRLALSDTDVDHACIILALEPTADSNSMNLTIAFGKKSVTVGLSLSSGKPVEASSKPSKGN